MNQLTINNVICSAKHNINLESGAAKVSITDTVTEVVDTVFGVFRKAFEQVYEYGYGKAVLFVLVDMCESSISISGLHESGCVGEFTTYDSKILSRDVKGVNMCVNSRYRLAAK